MLIVQLGLPPPASVKLTGRLSRVASVRASRSPLLIDSDVERISALRRKVVNEGRPARSIIPAIVTRHHELQQGESAGSRRYRIPEVRSHRVVDLHSWRGRLVVHSARRVVERSEPQTGRLRIRRQSRRKTYAIVLTGSRDSGIERSGRADQRWPNAGVRGAAIECPRRAFGAVGRKDVTECVVVAANAPRADAHRMRELSATTTARTGSCQPPGGATSRSTSGGPQVPGAYS